MNFWEAFVQLNPFIQWCALWLVWPPLLAIHEIVVGPFRIWRRLIRSRDIRECGWPPHHLDADGDFKTDEGK